MTLIIQTPNRKPAAQNGEIGMHAASVFATAPEDATEVSFLVTYPDRNTGELGAGASDIVTVNRLGVVTNAIPYDLDTESESEADPATEVGQQVAKPIADHA